MKVVATFLVLFGAHMIIFNYQQSEDSRAHQVII